MGWVSGGTQTNPGDLTILADTGALTAGTLGFVIMVVASTPCSVSLLHRNTTDTTTLHSISFPVVPGKPETFPWNLAVALNERLKLQLDTGFTGTVTGAISF